jgi:hypothetical protein
VKQRLTALAVVASAALIMTACSSSSGSDSGGSVAAPSSDTSSAPSTETTSESSSAAAPTSSTAAPTTSAAVDAASKPVPVNKSASDPVFGSKFTVLSYIRNYQVPAASKQKYSALEDEEVILVQLKVTAGKKYYVSFGPDDFYLTNTKNGYDEGESNSLLEGVIGEQSNLKVLEDASAGETSTGWVIFTPKKDGLKSLTLRYKRLAAGTSNGKTIPAKNIDIPLA